MIFKESQLFWEGKVTALPHNFKPNTWMSGGIYLVHFHPLSAKHLSQVHFADIVVFFLINSPM